MNKIPPYRKHRFSVQSGVNWECRYCSALLGDYGSRGECAGPFTCTPARVRAKCARRFPKVGDSCTITVGPSLLRPAIPVSTPGPVSEPWILA